MSDFVDATCMSKQDIQLMNSASDSDETTATCTWKPRAKKISIKHSVDNVWAAAVAAQRINGSYVKHDEAELPEHEATGKQLARRSNRNIMLDILANPAVLTVEDIAQAQECRKFLQNDITFRALKNKLGEFDMAISKCLAVAEEFDTATHRYEMAVVASLPASHQRSLARIAEQERVRATTGNYMGTVGAKVDTDIEVIKSFFSVKWNTWYVTAVTPNNSAVFFAYRRELPAGDSYQIRGTVKSLRDGTTQLNRVVITE